MNTKPLNVRDLVCNSAIAAVELAENKPSQANISFAKKILDVKMASPAESPLPVYVKKEYESLYLKLDKLEDKFNKASVMVVGDNLKYEAVKETNFRFKNLDTYEFFNTGLRNKDLRNCSFTGAKVMNPVRLFTFKSPRRVHFGHSNLNGVDLNGAEIFNVSFKNASMIGTKFTIRTTNPYFPELNFIEMNPCNFTGAILDGAEIGIELPPRWNDAMLDVFFNSTNNEYTLFNILETISDKYSEIKISLLKEVIDSLVSSEVDIDSPSFPSFEILNYIASKEIYHQDDKINAFVEKLIRNELSKANTALNWEPKTLALCFNVISQSKSEAGLKSYMIDNNGFFVKLIVLANNLDNARIKDQARALYSTYLSLDEVKPFIEKEEFGNGEQAADWSDDSYANYILINGNKAIIIDHDNISKMLHLNKTNTDIKWDCFYFYKNNECQATGDINYNELFFNDFRVFESSYRFDLDKASFVKLLSTLELADYHDRFNTVLSDKSVADKLKLVGTEEQLKLSEIFDKVLTRENDSAKETVLKADHYEEILSVFHLDSADEKIKAQHLLSLSAIFSKYSSSAVFGTEQESPQALRDYAYALMSKAHELAPEVMGDYFNNWKNSLLGLNNAFTCTAVLSTAMIYYSQTHFKDVISKIIPPVWA